QDIDDIVRGEARQGCRGINSSQDLYKSAQDRLFGMGDVTTDQYTRVLNRHEWACRIELLTETAAASKPRDAVRRRRARVEQNYLIGIENSSRQDLTRNRI